MSLLGKILAIFNVLAAAGFIYVATMDRGKRMEWSYAVYRHDLAIDGLPLDDQQRDVALGVRHVDKLGEKTLQDLSKVAGGPELKPTQHDEVKAEWDRMKTQWEGQDASDEARKQKLLPLAKSLATTWVERAALAQKSKEDLAAFVNGKFEDAVRPVGSFVAEGGKPQESAEKKRQAIAHLLFNLRQDDDWHSRVLVIIGLKAYAQECNREADKLNLMAQGIRLAMESDLADFASKNQGMLKEIQVRTIDLEGRKAFLMDQQKLKTQNENLVNQRTKERDDLKDKLEEARKATQAALDVQAKLEKTLFDAQRRARDAADANQKLERDIRSLEK